MLVEVGPVPAADVRGWTRFARRVLVEVRTDPGDLAGVATDDLLLPWSRLIDQWATAAADGESFRWSIRLESEMAEYLLYGLERCLFSPAVLARVTSEEAARQRPFTLHLVRAFVEGLEAEGLTHAHYADQVRASLGDSLN